MACKVRCVISVRYLCFSCVFHCMYNLHLFLILYGLRLKLTWVMMMMMMMIKGKEYLHRSAQLTRS